MQVSKAFVEIYNMAHDGSTEGNPVHALVSAVADAFGVPILTTTHVFYNAEKDFPMPLKDNKLCK